MTSGTPQTPDESTPGTAPVAVEPPPVDPGKGTGFGVVALVLGGLGCVLPLVPFDLADARAWISLPFALPGLVLGVLGCTGVRRGNAWSIAGSVLCAIAVGLSAVLIGFSPDPKENSGDGDHTRMILRDELDVRIGERYIDPENGIVSVNVTLYNKGPEAASYVATFAVDNRKETCEEAVSARNLVPDGSYQQQISSCSSKAPVADVSFQLIRVGKNR